MKRQNEDRIKIWHNRITDMNVSIGGRDARGKVADIAELTRIMDHYGIAHAACSHEYALLDPMSGNALMMETAAVSDGKIGATVILDPALGKDNLPGEGSLKDRLAKCHPEAVRICPIPDRSVFSVFYWEEILDAVNSQGLPLIIDYEYPPEFFLELPKAAESYPSVKFVLIRYGLCRSRLIMPLLEKCTNVYFTAEVMLDYLQIEEIAERYGTNRLLFGSGYPRLAPSGALGLILYADISDDEKEKILHGNWEELHR